MHTGINLCRLTAVKRLSDMCQTIDRQLSDDRKIQAFMRVVTIVRLIPLGQKSTKPLLRLN